MVAFAVCLVCKQTAWLMLPLACLLEGLRVAPGRDVGRAGRWSFTVPWVLAAPHAFYRGAVSYNLFLPARLDSLSLFTTALVHGWSPGLATLAVATSGAMAFVLWRLPHDTYGFLLGSAVVMAVFNLANKQSFFNEWSNSPPAWSWRPWPSDRQGRGRCPAPRRRSDGPQVGDSE